MAHLSLTLRPAIVNVTASSSCSGEEIEKLLYTSQSAMCRFSVLAFWFARIKRC